MKPRYNRLLLLVALFFAPVFKTQANDSFTTTGHEEKWSLEEEFFLQEQFRMLELPFASGYDQEVGRFIKQYLHSGKRQTELILGRGAYYFPIFEEYLRQYELPLVLKFLPVVESGLQPRVESGVGAAGLWQFMPVTAQYFRLEINDLVDERRDPYRSSEAAARLLSMHYRDFCDWALALAAYNCGPGRVRRAIGKAGSTRYEDIEPFLPIQTQRYIIKFKAAAYVASYYQFFGLNPRIPFHATRKVELIRVKEELTFGEIAEASGTDLATIRALNPAYLREVVPARRKGRMVALPQKGARRLITYLNAEAWQEPVAALPKKENNTALPEKEKRSPLAAEPAGKISEWARRTLAGKAQDGHNPKATQPQLTIWPDDSLTHSPFPPSNPAPGSGTDDSVPAAAWAQRQSLRIQAN